MHVMGGKATAAWCGLALLGLACPAGRARAQQAPSVPSEPSGQSAGERVASSAATDDEAGLAWSFLIETSVISTYVWRGEVFLDDRFEPTNWSYAQGTLDFGAAGALTLGVWTDVPFRPQDAITPEIDPYLAYELPAGPVSIGALFWVFLYPEDHRSGGELVGGYAINLDATFTGAALAPTVALSVDPFVGEELYYFVQIDPSETWGRWTLALSSRLGFSHAYGDPADPHAGFGFQDWTTSLTTRAALEHGFYASLMGQLGVAMQGHEPKTLSDVDLDGFDVVIALTPSPEPLLEHAQKAGLTAFSVDVVPPTGSLP